MGEQGRGFAEDSVDERNGDRNNWTDLWGQYGNLDHRGMEVDDIKWITDGDHPLEETNLQTLCTDYHSEKTVDENSDRYLAPNVTLTDYLDLEF